MERRLGDFVTVNEEYLAQYLMLLCVFTCLILLVILLVCHRKLFGCHKAQPSPKSLAYPSGKEDPSVNNSIRTDGLDYIEMGQAKGF